MITFNMTSEMVVSQKSLKNSSTSILFTQAENLSWRDVDQKKKGINTVSK